MTRKECLEQAMRIVEEMKGYESLVQVYQDAVIQASKGKGRERHAVEGEAYEDQIICEVARRVGLGYPLGQAVKKIYESQRIGGERGVAELLGALNYVAAAVIVMREGLDTAPKADEEPKFKSGDRVQYRVELPSVSDWIWRDATYLRPAFSWQQDGEHIVSSDDLGPVTVKDKDIRPAPKAEGVEELVQKDAPQTPQELYQHIVNCNPSIYKPRTPTGEELAEMAEEEPHG
jgi:hypothetical protein